MPSRTTTRYCIDPDALATMKRDGLGWGHDLECGTYYDVTLAKKPRGFAWFSKSLKRRT